MVGALDAEAVMTPRLTLRYQTLVVAEDGLLGPAGTRATGHEFHRTTVTPERGGHGRRLARRRAGVRLQPRPGGLGRATVHASYQHVHWAGHPRLAQRFADAVHDHARPHDATDAHDVITSVITRRTTSTTTATATRPRAWSTSP